MFFITRAVYHGSDMYLLDDVLSAVDSQVGCWILQRALLGPLLNKKTRVMCTHNIQVSIYNEYLSRSTYFDGTYLNFFSHTVMPFPL